MKIILKIFIAFISSQLMVNFCVHSQNLVPNPSFEDNINCPTTLSDFEYLTYWLDPNAGSSDYYSACDTLNNVGVPINISGFQNAHSANSYVGIATYFATTREYIQVQLISPLIAQKKYSVEFYVNLSDSSNYATNEMGAYFSNNTITNTPQEPILVNPQISNSSSNNLNDKINWMKISGDFYAAGGEQYITIGNFKTNANTIVYSVPGGAITWPYILTYYYIDDVSVTLDTTIGITEIEKQNIRIFPNPATSEITVSGYSPAYLKLCNAVGQTVAESKSNKLYVGNLSQGLYVLQLFDAKGQQVKTEKVIVAK